MVKDHGSLCIKKNILYMLTKSLNPIENQFADVLDMGTL